MLIPFIGIISNLLWIVYTYDEIIVKLPLALVLFLMSINGGIAVCARSSIKLEELDETIKHAIQTFT